jgi:hypothetical protein
LAYVDGTLDEAQINRFEEHYFECALCHEQVRSLIALRDELHERSAPSLIRVQKNTSVFRMPLFVWTMGLGCLVVVAGVVFYHARASSNVNSDLAANGSTPAAGRSPSALPSSSSASAPSNPASTTADQQKPLIDASRLADLVLPVYAPHALRGQTADENMAAGMAAYQSGDCRKAADQLALVKSASDDYRAAHFYRGLCQLHLGQLYAAQASLNFVVQAGESPEQEGALYAQAQVALAQNNPALAQKYLGQTIALQGSLESRARAQNSKLLALMAAHK